MWKNTSCDNDGLVSNLKDSGLLTNKYAEIAMRSVDRGVFIPASEPKKTSTKYAYGAYADAPQTLGFGATVSAPWVQAMALNELSNHIAKPSSVTLDVGSGSGIMVAYFCCLAKVCGQTKRKVVGVEVLPGLVELSRMYLKRCGIDDDSDLVSVDVIQGNGWTIHEKLKLQFDAIHVGAQATTLPENLIKLLKPGGRLVCPVGPKQKQGKLIVVDKSMDGKNYTTRICSESVRFVPLIRENTSSSSSSERGHVVRNPSSISRDLKQEQHHHKHKQDWNKRYTSGWAYGKKPNEFLVECITKHIEPQTTSSPLRILCIACGQGRNAVWLAERGHDVVAIDASDVGIRKAHLLASQRGVTIDATVNDANVWKSKEKFDVIVDVFSSLSNKTRRVRNRRWVRMLAHDGFYLNVSFAPKHREINTSGPVDLVSLEMLRGDIRKSMDIVVERTRQTRLSEGSFHRGPSILTEFLARKNKVIKFMNYKASVDSLYRYFQRFKSQDLIEFVRRRTNLVANSNSTKDDDTLLRCGEAILRVIVAETQRRDSICRYCWIEKDRCLCCDSSSSASPYQFTVIQHPNEFMRSTSSAKVALQHLTNDAELLLYGAPEHRSAIVDRVRSDSSVVLFPHKNACPCEDLSDVSNVIVVDGSWKNCHAMVDDMIRINPKLRFVRLNENSVATFHSPLIESLKAGQGLGRISTLEAMALFLREMRHDDMCSSLLEAELPLCKEVKRKHTTFNANVAAVKRKKEWTSLLRKVAKDSSNEIRDGLRYCVLCKETLATPSRMTDHICGKKHCERVLEIAVSSDTSSSSFVDVPDLNIAKDMYRVFSVEVMEKTIPEPCDVALVRIRQGLYGKLKSATSESSTKVKTKGERLLRHDVDPPRNVLPLPSNLRKRMILKYDNTIYDLRNKATVLLSRCKHLGSFPNHIHTTNKAAMRSTLEEFRPCLDVFRNFKARQQVREAVCKDEEFLATYERLVCDVIIPFLKTHLEDPETPRVYHYQYPCTLRLQPGPSKAYNRVHRDAEYGHQIGEINFWMPLSDYALTHTALEVETSPSSNIFKPLDISIGEIGMFHGTLLHHRAPANASVCTRVSLDFRIGIEGYFDPNWKLRGVKAQHTRRFVKM